MTKGQLLAALAHVSDNELVDIGVDLGFGEIRVLEIASARLVPRIEKRVASHSARLFTEVITQPILPAIP